VNARGSMTRRHALLATAAFAPLLADVKGRPVAPSLDVYKREQLIGISGAVAAEQTAMVAFEAIANGGVLDPRATATMRILLDHATFHATVLGDSLKSELGDDPPLPPKRTQIPGLERARTRLAALRLAMRLEERAVAAHLVAVRRTNNAQILRTIAGIVGSDGQSLVLLRQLLGEPPVPSAFERGI
jgi:Ferritin-like domain